MGGVGSSLPVSGLNPCYKAGKKIRGKHPEVSLCIFLMMAKAEALFLEQSGAGVALGTSMPCVCWDCEIAVCAT